MAWTWFKSESIDAQCSWLKDGLEAIATVLKISGLLTEASVSVEEVFLLLLLLKICCELL